VTPGFRAVDEHTLESARWRLLATSDAEDARSFGDEFARAEASFAGTGQPQWDAWGSAFTARARLFDADLGGAAQAVAVARAALERCPLSAERALVLAYLAHVEVAADRFDAALHLAVDASLLADQLSGEQPTRALHQAHHWLSLALTRLDLEELAAPGWPRRSPTSPTAGSCCGCAPSSTRSWPRRCTGAATNAAPRSSPRWR
jgi:hypothetical protein